MNKLYESRNVFETITLEEIEKELPEGLKLSQVKVVPVYATYGEYGLNELVGFKFVVYDEA